MAVLIEKTTLVIPLEKLEDRFPGGREAFLDLVHTAEQILGPLFKTIIHSIECDVLGQ